MTENRITTKEHSYFTMIPNLADDMGLDPYAFRLYAHIRRVAGDGGACWQSTDTLAKHCKMSVGSVSDAKKELVKAGLISIETRTKSGTRYHHITITDIWLRNMQAYAGSPGEDARSQGESVRSPGETKKNPIKKNPLPKESDEPSSPPTITTKHPAIKAFKSAAHRYPAKSWYKRVGDAVGSNTDDVKFWGDVVFGWVGSGWNPTNVKGMLDCYEQRRIPGTNGGKRNGRTIGGPGERKASLADGMGQSVAELLGDTECLDAGG